MRLSAPVKQLLSWSVFGWVLSGALCVLYKVVSGRSWADAFFGAALLGGLLLLAIGATGLGVGGVQTASHSAASYAPNKKMDQPGARLTSFGAALVVAIQLAAAAFLTLPDSV